MSPGRRWDRTKDERRIFSALKKGKNVDEAARILNVTRAALSGVMRAWAIPYKEILLRAQLGAAVPMPEKPPAGIVLELEAEKTRCAQLKKEIDEMNRLNMTGDMARRFMRELGSTDVQEPDWLVKMPKSPSVPGVPVLFCSDEHVGEVINPIAVAGQNEYNLEIAEARHKRVVEKFLELCFKYTVNPQFPGCVLLWGGDGVSGNIHEELLITNERPVLECTLMLRDWRVKVIKELLKHFEQVYVVSVSGNHSRTTKKIISKEMVFSTFDWMCAQEVKRAFDSKEYQKRVRFLIPAALDARFRIYGTRYVLSHGYEPKGGDGIIGNIGPITRGDIKRRARDAMINLPYHVSLHAHHHEFQPGLERYVNGSMCGYSEHAYRERFRYQSPIQAAWLSHPEFAISYHFPIFLEPSQMRKDEHTTWISWPEGQEERSDG